MQFRTIISECGTANGLHMLNASQNIQKQMLCGDVIHMETERSEFGAAN